jgi:hypothetical protein
VLRNEALARDVIVVERIDGMVERCETMQVKGVFLLRREREREREPSL